MSKSVRTTISVPADLKARMDAVGEPVNWSAVACQAFALKVAEITARKGVKTMSDVVARLRASKQQHEDATFRRGVEAGEEWAKGHAEAAQLERLERLNESEHGDLRGVFLASETSAYGPGEHFYFLIEPEDTGSRTAARDFWSNWVSDDDFVLPSDPDFVRGFAEGALNVWFEVKDQL